MRARPRKPGAKPRKIPSYWPYDLEFNWYAEHTRKELSEAIYVDEKTIRVECEVDPSIKRPVGKTMVYLYTAEESLDVLYWWLTELLPKRTKKDTEFPLYTARNILFEMLNKKDLSEDAKKIVTKKILPVWGAETLKLDLTRAYAWRRG